MMLQTKLLQWFYKELHLFSRIAAASLLFCFFFSSSNIKALTVDKGSYIGKYVYIYEDSEGSVPHTDILDKKFTKSSFKIPSFGYTSSVIWVDLNLSSLADRHEDLILEVNNIAIDKIEVFKVNHSGLPEKSGEFGDSLPFNDRDFFYRNFAIEVSSKNRYMLKFSSKSSLKLPIRLWTHKGFFHHSLYEYTLFMFYYGLIVCLAISSIIFFLFTTRKSYLIYSIFIFSFFLLHTSLDGFAYQYLWPNIPQIKKGINLILFSLFSASMIWYVKHYLYEISFFKRSRRSNLGVHFMNFMMASWALFAFLSQFFYYTTMVKVAFLWNIFTLMFLLTFSIFATKRLPKQSLFLLVGLVADVIGLLIYFGKSVGTLKYSFFTEHSTKFTYLIQFFSFQIGTSRYIRENEIRSKENEILAREATVQLKESELKAKENSIKALAFEEIMKIVSYITHELKRPFAIIKDFLFEIEEKIDDTSLNKVEMNFISAVNMSHRILANLSGFDEKRLNKLDRKPSSFYNIIMASFQEIQLSYSHRYSAKLRYQFNHKSKILVNVESVVTAMINIFENSLEATAGNTEIEIKTVEDEKYICINISNSNSSIDDQSLPSIFNMGFSSKQSGHGFGLYIVNTIVRSNHGYINCESGENKVNFMLCFPKSEEIDNEKILSRLPSKLNPMSYVFERRAYINRRMLQRNSIETITVSILDDDGYFLEVLKRRIESISEVFSVTTYQKYTNDIVFKEDILLIDINLAGNVNGINIVNELKRKKGQKIFLMSIRNLTVIPQNCDGFLSKPISKFVITNVVNKWISENWSTSFSLVFLDDHENSVSMLEAGLRKRNLNIETKIFVDIDQMLDFVESNTKDIDMVFIDRFIFNKDMLKSEIPDSLHFIGFEGSTVLWSLVDMEEAPDKYDLFLCKDWSSDKIINEVQKLLTEK